MTETRTAAPSTRSGHIGLIVVGSLATGLAAALLHTHLFVFAGAAEAVVTGSAMLAFGLGWAMLAVLSMWRTDQPQRWALVPAALPASPVTRKRSIRVSAVVITLVRGWLSLLPSLIAAGFCERAAGSRGAQRPRAAPQAPLTRPAGSGSCQAAGGREPLVARDAVQRFRRAAFLREVTSSGGRGRGQEQPALPRSAGRHRRPGDMMIDRVSPPRRGCGRSV